MLDISMPGDAVIHGDAKISNMIMQAENVIGFIENSLKKTRSKA